MPQSHAPPISSPHASPSSPHPQPPGRSPPNEELVFLALHLLHEHDAHAPVANALSALESALSDLCKLPTATDYTGTPVTLTYSQCASRFSHVPQSYLRDALRARMPNGPLAPDTLLANGRYATAPNKRPRPRSIAAVKARLAGRTTNVATLIDQQTFLPVPPPLPHLTLTLLPSAFRKLKRLVGHHCPVFTTVFDHSARRIVTGSDDSLLKIWSTDTAFLQHTLRGHDSNITEIVKHPTAPIIVSASSDTTLRVWNLQTAAALCVLDGGTKEVNTVQFSPCPDRPYLVSGGADGSVRLWNADHFEAGFLTIPIPQRTVSRHATDTRNAGSSPPAPSAPSNIAATSAVVPTSPRPHPTCSHVASASNNPITSQHPPPNASIQMSNFPNNPPHFSTQATVSPLPSPVASPPHTAVAGTMPTGQHSVRLNSNSAAAPSAQPNSQPPPPARHPAAANSMVSGTPLYEVLSVAFNAGATRLVISGTDCLAHVFAVEPASTTSSRPHLPSIRPLTTLRGHSDSIMQVLFSRSGDRIVTAGRDGVARIWRRTKARLPLTRKRKQPNLSGMGSWSSILLDCRARIQADARSLVSGGAASGSACGSIVPRVRLASFPVSVCATMWSLDDKYVLTSSSDAKIRVWRADTGQLAHILGAHEREVYVMDCHPHHEKILLSAGYDGKCFLWDIDTGKMLRSFSVSDDGDGVGGDGSKRCISDGQFASDGMSFVVSDTSGGITIFGVGSGEATALAPEEQFFSNDHAPIRRDAQQRVVNETTGRLLHLEQSGRLCDRNFLPHPPELQPLPATTSSYGEDDSGVVMECRGIDATDANGDKCLAGKHPNVIQNREHHFLQIRAEEFRRNQEREERRLNREARNERRRQIIEREKASLRNDKEASVMPLRDFEVPDSEYEDSDEDFDAGEDPLKPTDSSSSEDEEEDDDDEIRPARKGSSKPSSASKRKSSEVRGLRLPQSRCGRRKRNVHQTARIQTIGNSGESDGDADADQDRDDDDYQHGSQGSDSDDSVGGNKGERSTRRFDRKADSNVDERQIAKPARSVTGKLMTSPNSVPPGVPSVAQPSGIVGTSHEKSQRRMKIYVERRPPSTKAVHATSSNPECAAEVHDSQSRRDHIPAQNVVLGTNSAISTGREQRSEAAGFTGIQASHNPSHTTERKYVTVDVSRGLMQVEEHQGDTASCFKPSENRNAAETAPKTPMSSTKPHATSILINGGDGVTKPHDSVDGPEKSVLSDSVARLTRKRWRNRSEKDSGGDDVAERGIPEIDIDFVAQRELEILDAQRVKKRRKLRRRNNVGDSEFEHSSDEAHDGVKGDIGEGQKKSRSQRRRGKSNELDFENQSRCLEASAWLRCPSNRYTYVPQVGDDIMYFPEGHVAAMAIARNAGLEPLLDKASYKRVGKEVLDGSSFSKEWSPLRFQIMDMTYQFPTLSQKTRALGSKSKAGKMAMEALTRDSKTVVVLTLRFLSGMRRRAGQTDRFVLSYFPVDAPEYVVLTSRVDVALQRQWKTNDRFRILFLNENRSWQYYTGTVRNVKSTLQTTIWNSIEVQYDDEAESEVPDTELVSPWELEAFDILEASKDNGVAMHGSSLRSVTVEPGLFPLIARDLDAIQSMESTWRTQLSWLDNVNSLSSLPSYSNIIPCPMDLNIILVRLCTGYYRHFCSFIHDLSLLKSNATRFHGSQSEMGLLATKVCTRIIDTSEKIRAQFGQPIPQFAHPLPPIHGTTQASSRTIRPRPSPPDLAPHAAATVSPQNTIAANSRQYSVSLRHPNGSFPVPGYATVDGTANTQALMTMAQQRMWNGIRLQAPHPPNVAYSQSPGVSLPPTLRGSTNGNSSRGTGRAPRGGARSKAVRQHANTLKQASTAGLPLGSSSPGLPLGPSSPIMAGVGVTSPPPLPPQYSHPHFLAPATNTYALASQSGVVSNSGHAPASVGLKMALSSVISHPRATRPSSVASAGGPAADTASRYVGAASPTLEHPHTHPHAIAHATVSATQAGAAAQANRGIRAGSTADGGAHSWSRSIEGAGGTGPIHASTSDSHLPVRHGRAHSPISPGAVAARQGTSVASVPPTPAYHEHSTVSMAAAESTMSCGGAEVALQAASAESIEVATTSRRIG